MPDNSRSSREIERDIEQERAELRGTIDEIMNRLTFQDAWNRAGEYMRENRSEFGYTLGRMVKEKPIAVALTAIGVSWLLFGPSSGAARPGRRATYAGDGRAHGATDYSRTDTRSPLSGTEPGGPAQGRVTPETGAGRPPSPAETRTGSPAAPTRGATMSTPGTSTPSSTGTAYPSERPTPSTTGAASTTPGTATAAGSAGGASTSSRPGTTAAGSAETKSTPSGVGETAKRDASPETSPSNRADESRSDESRS